MTTSNTLALFGLLQVIACGVAAEGQAPSSAGGQGGVAGSGAAGAGGQAEGAPERARFRESLLVPGGTFPMGRGAGDEYDFSDSPLPVPSEPEHDATLSDFYLEQYEVTVARFRLFLADFDGKSLPAGAGAHPLIEGSGWNPAWVDGAPFRASEVLWDFGRSAASSWTDEPAENEDRPINNITWLVAFQFCVWDGARLPTEAEWEYAAAGGSQDRLFPWGHEAATSRHANFGATLGRSSPVGSYPEGAGRWGHLDLAGNVAEWVFDAHDVDDAEQWYSMPCIDCARADDWRVRVIKGGHFDSAERALRPASRSIMDREYWNHDRGVRCAHSDKR